MIPEFVARIVEGNTDRTAARHELHVVSACVAADQALAEGGVVEIEYA